MKKPVALITSPGQLTLLAALLAGLSGAASATGSSNLVISQVFAGGGNSGAPYTYDYVELFNRGAAPFTTGDWSLQYASTAGVWSSRVALSNITIPAGGYYLVQLQTANSAIGGALPTTPDMSSTSINMSASNGKIALANIGAQMAGGGLNANVVDMVGYGTANAYEGTAAPAPSATTALFRAANGCTDTDVNSSDFTAAGFSPSNSPRNSKSAANSCSGAGGAAPIMPTCTGFTVQQGVGGSGPMSATDSDSSVNGVSFTTAPASGITLGTFTAAGAPAQPGSVSLNVAASMAAAVYPVSLTFVNDANQSATCGFNVTVQAPAATSLTVAQVQGSGATSPYDGTAQTVEGVITMKLPGAGFYIQDQVATAGASSGIYVFGSTTGYLVGDLVRVTGTIFEYKPGTQAKSFTEIKDATLITKQASVAPIAPTNITMPTDLSKYEGMLVSFTNDLIINDVNSLGERGEMTLASRRREVPTNRYPAGSPAAVAMAASNAADQIVLDDTLFSVPNPIPYVAADQTVRVGDTVSHLVGVVDFASIGNNNYGYKLQPQAVSSVAISRTNQRTAAPVLPVGNVRVASANVLNFFTTMIKDGYSVVSESITAGCTVGTTTTWKNCRGADTREEFVRQRDKIVNELVAIDADVVGLMEIQNNGDDAVSYLVNSINAKVGFPMYAYVPQPPTTGTDAIRVAMIYKPQVLSLAGASMSDSNAINNRHPIAQTFKAANGAKFSVIVNHLKSKGGSCPSSGSDADKNDSQGCYNGTRILQANQLANVFIPVVQAAAGDPDVLVIGDMNSHGFEDPINVLTAKGMVNELEFHVRPTGLVYSYVFDGASGYLDHALATASLHGQVAGATEWHNNADEPEVIDYNFGQGTSNAAKPQDLYVNNAYRASDHDPVVVSLKLTPPPPVDVTAGVTVQRAGYTINRTTLQYNGTVSVTNISKTAAISGPVQLELSGLPTGVTLINKSGEHNGVPYITLSAGSLAPGATVTVPTQFGNPTKATITFTSTIYSGTF